VVTKKEGGKNNTFYPPPLFLLSVNWLTVCVCLVGFPFVLSFYICVWRVWLLYGQRMAIGGHVPLSMGGRKETLSDCWDCTWPWYQLLARVPHSSVAKTRNDLDRQEHSPRRAMAKRNKRWAPSSSSLVGWGDPIVRRERTAWRRRTSFKKIPPFSFSPFFLVWEDPPSFLFLCWAEPPH
jgi:hypothetical protein